jgi:hypothetical protein
VLIPIHALLERTRHPRSRVDEVQDVRERLSAAPSSRAVAPDTRRRAKELMRLRQVLSDAIGTPESCRTCAVDHDLPHGRFEGGYCCGGRTEDLFTDPELATLRAAGVGPFELTPPRGDHAGCAFRGPTGCSLPPTRRPNLCVRYVCTKLARELHARGDAPHVRRLIAELEGAWERYE